MAKSLLTGKVTSQGVVYYLVLKLSRKFKSLVHLTASGWLIDLDDFLEDFVEGRSDPEFEPAPGARQADEPPWFPMAPRSVEPLPKASEKLERALILRASEMSDF